MDKLWECCFYFLMLVWYSSKRVSGGKVSLLVKDAKTPITHLYLDFDHTITEDGFSEDVRQMFCKDQKYPDCDCSWLPGKVCNGTDQESIDGMITQLDSLPAGGLPNLTQSLGGAERLENVRLWLSRNRKLMDGNIYIVSTSWYPVTGLQWKAYLFKVSEMLDLGFKEDEILTLADPGPGKSADKGSVIKKHMSERNVKSSSAMFADDSSGNIKTAKGVCNTVYLPNRIGLDDTDLQYIEALAGGLNLSTSSAAQHKMVKVSFVMMITAVVLIIMK